MTTKAIKYTHSHHPEDYFGPELYDTAEEALSDALDEYVDDEFVYVAEAHSVKIGDYVTDQIAASLMDMVDEQSWAEHEDDNANLTVTSKDQLTDLTERLKQTLNAWADDHGLHPDYTAVKNVRKFGRDGKEIL